MDKILVMSTNEDGDNHFISLVQSVFPEIEVRHVSPGDLEERHFQKDGPGDHGEKSTGKSERREAYDDDLSGR